MNTTSTPSPASPFITLANRLDHAQRAAGAVRFSQLEPENIRWLWPGRIPLGRVTLLVSDPGLGKSLLTLEIAARVSAGTRWPDYKAATVGRGTSPDLPPSTLPPPPSSVLLLTAEDDFADTIRPRLEALGANCDRVLGISTVASENANAAPRPFALNRDLPRLNDLLDALPDCRLIIIDPISAFLGGTSESSNADIQTLLLNLTTLARERNLAVLIVSHLRKKEGAAIHRTMGSLAFVAAVRSAWAICKHPSIDHQRLFVPIKNNLAPDTGGLVFSIETAPDGHTPVVRWSQDPVSQSVEFAVAATRTGRPDEERQHAVRWLRKRLSKGPRPTTQVKEEAEAFGIQYGTLRRAFRDLDGEAIRRGPFPFGAWNWRLPGVDAQNGSGELCASTEPFDELAALMNPWQDPT